MLRKFPFHPLLFAAYPVLFLFADNLQEQVSTDVLFRPLAVVLAGAALMMALLATVLRPVDKAAVVATVLILLFFSFGHVARGLGASKDEELVQLIIWGSIALLATFAMMRARDTSRLTFILNSVALVLVMMNVVWIGLDEAARSSFTEAPEIGKVTLADPAKSSRPKRDIYYLVFDRYAAASTLERLYDYENRDFLDGLRNRGFYVADRSAANHLRTGHSLASSLSMTYLERLEEAHPASDDRAPLYSMLRDPPIARLFQSVGYSYHHIGSWASVTASSRAADVIHHPLPGTEFESVLVKTTVWPALLERFAPHDARSPEPDYRQIVHRQFRSVRHVQEDPGPSFTFAHFLIPHDPYVFTRSGAPVTADLERSRTERENYLEQLIYSNGLIESLVDDLLEGPEDQDPIVIIQSDEGPHPPRMVAFESMDWTTATDSELREKLLILNAYYLPGEEHDLLYPSISPVNSFRVILNQYFGARLPLLEDKTYIYPDDNALYDFIEVTERLGIPQEEAASP